MRRAFSVLLAGIISLLLKSIVIYREGNNVLGGWFWSRLAKQNDLGSSKCLMVLKYTGVAY